MLSKAITEVSQEEEILLSGSENVMGRYTMSKIPVAKH